MEERGTRGFGLLGFIYKSAREVPQGAFSDLEVSTSGVGSAAARCGEFSRRDKEIKRTFRSATHGPIIAARGRSARSADFGQR
jgi:hypothetical protein